MSDISDFFGGGGGSSTLPAFVPTLSAINGTNQSTSISVPAFSSSPAGPDSYINLPDGNTPYTDSMRYITLATGVVWSMLPSDLHVSATEWLGLKYDSVDDAIYMFARDASDNGYFGKVDEAGTVTTIGSQPITGSYSTAYRWRGKSLTGAVSAYNMFRREEGVGGIELGQYVFDATTGARTTTPLSDFPDSQQTNSIIIGDHSYLFAMAKDEEYGGNDGIWRAISIAVRGNINSTLNRTFGPITYRNLSSYGLPSLTIGQLVSSSLLAFRWLDWGDYYIPITAANTDRYSASISYTSIMYDKVNFGKTLNTLRANFGFED